MFRFDVDSPIHPVIAACVDALGGEPAEASAEGLINWLSEGGVWSFGLYQARLDGLRQSLRDTDGQMVLTEIPGAWSLWTPFTAIYHNPPVGTFRRFTLSFPCSRRCGELAHAG